MAKAIFLDRDGTINVEKNYLYRVDDFEFLPGVVEALKMLVDSGYLLIIITNQSGIARGYYTEEDVRYLNTWLCSTLKSKSIGITDIYYCPHHPDAVVEKYKVQCDCRKPELGLFEQAITTYNIELKESYAIGDKLRDCMICTQSDCKGYLIGANEDVEIIDDVISGKYVNVSYQKDLLECAKEICGHN